MQKVAFIGAGTMGMGMLSNLVQKGFETRVFDIAQTALEQASTIGAIPTRTAAEAARESDIVITMLPTAEAVEWAYRSEASLGRGLRSGHVCIDMSTIDPGTAQRLGSWLSELGVSFIDAPVSGGGPKAWEGTLTIMAGGEAAAVSRIWPVLEAMGSKIVHVGPCGSGSVAKLANNIVASASMVATAEAFQLGVNYGVEPRVLTDILAESSGNTWVLHNMHPVPGVRPGSPSSNGYTPGFSTVLMLEMLDLIRTAAYEKGIALSIVPAMQQVWELAANHGYAQKDCTSVYEFIGPQADGRVGIGQRRDP